jgi:hypothetical protein
MLDNFFRINLPYGIEKNKDGAWTAFNREYLPIGFGQKEFSKPRSDYDKLPIFRKYRKLTDKFLTDLACDKEGISRDENGEIVKVWLYRDSTNPVNSRGKNSELWQDYFDKIKRLSRIEIDF